MYFLLNVSNICSIIKSRRLCRWLITEKWLKKCFLKSAVKKTKKNLWLHMFCISQNERLKKSGGSWATLFFYVINFFISSIIFCLSSADKFTKFETIFFSVSVRLNSVVKSSIRLCGVSTNIFPSPSDNHSGLTLNVLQMRLIIISLTSTRSSSILTITDLLTPSFSPNFVWESPNSLRSSLTRSLIEI